MVMLFFAADANHKYVRQRYAHCCLLHEQGVERTAFVKNKLSHHCHWFRLEPHVCTRYNQNVQKGMVELGFLTQEEVDNNCAWLTASMYGNIDAVTMLVYNPLRIPMQRTTKQAWTIPIRHRSMHHIPEKEWSDNSGSWNHSG